MVLGRYKFPTVLARCEDGLLPDPAVRAAYLTAKRLRKDSGQLDEWSTIAGLSEKDPDRYRDLLSSLLGERYALRIFEAVTAGRVPSDELRRRALMRLRLRRLRNPGPVTEAAWKGSLRWLSRLTQPTGMVVVIAGPDGSGKSTLAQELPADVHGLFLQVETRTLATRHTPLTRSVGRHPSARIPPDLMGRRPIARSYRVLP